MVSLVAGVTLVVLVSMVTPDLVCGGQEGGEDSRLTHTHLTHTQWRYTTQTGGARSTTFNHMQNTPHSSTFESYGTFEDSDYNGRLNDAELPDPHSGQQDKLRRESKQFDSGIPFTYSSVKKNDDKLNAVRSVHYADNKCNEVDCIDNAINDNTEPKRNSVADTELNGVMWNKDDTLLDERNKANSIKGPVVVTHSGPVCGLTLDKAHVFYGIPYAAPPLGPKRWTPPEPVSPWTQPYDATFPRPACVQACAGEFSQMCPPKVIYLSKE